MGENTKGKKIIVAIGYNDEYEKIHKEYNEGLEDYVLLKQILNIIKSNKNKIKGFKHTTQKKEFENLKNLLSPYGENDESIVKICDSLEKIISNYDKLGLRKINVENFKTEFGNFEKVEEKFNKQLELYENSEIYTTIKILQDYHGNENCEIIDYEELNLEEIKESNKDSVDEIIFVSHNSAGSDKITIKENTEHKKEDILENLIQIWKTIDNKENVPLTIYACKALEQYNNIIRKKAETDNEIADLKIQASVFGLHPNMYYGKDKISDSTEINEFFSETKFYEKPIIMDDISRLVGILKKKEKRLNDLFNEIDKVYKNFIQNIKNTTIKEINDNDIKDERTKAKQKMSQMLDSVFNELKSTSKSQQLEKK